MIALVNKFRPNKCHFYQHDKNSANILLIVNAGNCG